MCLVLNITKHLLVLRVCVMRHIVPYVVFIVMLLGFLKVELIFLRVEGEALKFVIYIIKTIQVLM